MNKALPESRYYLHHFAGKELFYFPLRLKSRFHPIGTGVVN